MKITITGRAYHIASKIKLEDYTALKKANPKALKIQDEEGNDLFAISYKEECPSVSSFGVTFSETSGENKCLAITGMIPTGENAKNFVADLVSSAYANLMKLEETIPEEAKKVAEERTKLLESITEA